MTAEVTAADALFGFGSLNRANAGASAALDALIGVNYVFAVAFADGADRAFTRACAAGDAVITDFVCHDSLPPYENRYIVSQKA